MIYSNLAATQTSKIAELTEINAQLCGHRNAKQKIQYLLKVGAPSSTFCGRGLAAFHPSSSRLLFSPPSRLVNFVSWFSDWFDHFDD